MRSVVLLASAVLVAASLGWQAAVARLAVGRPFTIAVTYTETNKGKDTGQISTGIEGMGTISMHAGKLPTGLPATALVRGGRYVVRYDIDAAGTYHGTMVVTSATPSLGSVCLVGDVAFGKYDPTAGTGFPPTSGTFTSVGGTKLGATLGLKGRYKMTRVTGREDTLLRLAATGTVTTTLTAPKAMTKTCLSVAKLART